jgi:formate dehydrogenase
MQIVNKRAPGRRNKVYFNKGRQTDLSSLSEARKILNDFHPLQKDMLIEYLHIFNDKFGGLYAKHLKALADLTKQSMSEVYEVATFYAHFNIIDGETLTKSEITVKVCDSITCFMHKSEQLIDEIKNKHSNLNIERAPCMGRCNLAPVVEVHHNHVCNADINKIDDVIEKKDFSYKNDKHVDYESYLADGGYDLYKKNL